MYVDARNKGVKKALTAVINPPRAGDKSALRRVKLMPCLFPCNTSLSLHLIAAADLELGAKQKGLDRGEARTIHSIGGRKTRFV